MTTPTEHDATRDLPRTPDGKQVVCAWLTLADLDFPDAAAASAHHLLLDALAGDVRALVAEEHLGHLDAVVLAGDSARSGQTEEYEAAVAALVGPKGSLGVAPEAIYPVPGDRDVDRGRDDDGLVQYVLHAHREPRQSAHGTPWPIDEALRRDVVRDVLLTRLEGYMRFADRLAPTPVRGWWARRMPSRRPDAVVRLVGLNTALLCTGDDRGRLAVGKTQLAETLIGGDAALVIGVSHHPLDGPWLTDAEAHVVHNAMVSRCQVLVASCAAGNRIERTSTAAGEVIHLGCSLSPDADGAHGHLLAALLADDEGETSLRVWPRVTTKGGRFAADTTALEDTGARFKDLPLGLSLPSDDVPTRRSEVDREPTPEPWTPDAARVVAFLFAALDDPQAWRRARERLPAEARAILPPTRPATDDMVRHLTRLMGQSAVTPDAEPPAERLAECVVDAIGAGLRGEMPDLGAPDAHAGDGLRRPRRAFFERLAARPIDLRVDFDRSLGTLERAKEAIRRRFGREARSRRYREGSSIITFEAPLANAAKYWLAHRSAGPEPGFERDELVLRRLTWLSDDGPRDLPVSEGMQPGSEGRVAPTTADRDVAAMIDGFMRRESRDVQPLAGLWGSPEGRERLLLARAVRRMLPVFGDDFGRAARAVGAVAGRVERPAEALSLLARFDGTRGADDVTLRHSLERLIDDRQISDPRESEQPYAMRAPSEPRLLAELRALSGESGVIVSGETPHRPAMVRIPAGSFLMGSPEDEAGRWSDEGPRHRVTLARDFLLGATPVTAAQFETVMGDSPSRRHDDRTPITGVSWFDAAKFCNRLSGHEGRRPAYGFRGDDVILIEGADGYRLPSEAQWEYACRAGTSTRYWSGNDETDLARVGWFHGNSDTPQPVAEKPPNPWGLYDMHGNVWEWCHDRYGPYPGGPRVDPQGPPRGVYRVVRGGSFVYGARNARSAVRFWRHPAHRSRWLGFRLAAPPPPDLDLDG